MSQDRPKYTVRPLHNNDGYVVDACWPCGRTEQLVGVFVSEQFAIQMAHRFARKVVDLVAPAE
jgi:hypothetical protein